MLRIFLLGLFSVIIGVVTEKCTTPNNEEAVCVPLSFCPSLATALPDQDEFLRRSSCGGTALDPLVCCGSATSFALKSSTWCGCVKPRDNSKTWTFPWLARISLRGIAGAECFECVGSLVGGRYVVSVAHCFDNQTAIPIAVRLGEATVDRSAACMENIEDPAVQTFNIERALLHPNYDIRSKSNDIALVRLDKPYLPSDTIRPICLPPRNTPLQVGNLLRSAAWGRSGALGKPSEVQKTILGRAMAVEECRMAFKKMAKVTEMQICTSWVNTSDATCMGDSGAPLMSLRRGQWYLEGIGSFGKGCDGRFPEVYTRVSSYLGWILDNMEE